MTELGLGADLGPRALDPRQFCYFDWLLPRQHPKGYRLWATLGVVLSGLCVVWYVYTGIYPFLTTFLPLAAGVAIVPVAVRAGHRMVCRWEATAARFVDATPDEFREWFTAQVTSYLRSWDVPALGVGYLLAAFFAFRSSGAFAGMTLSGRVFSAIVLLISAFCCGVGIATICRLAKIVWGLGRFKVEITSGSFGVTSTGPLLVRCYAIAGAVWCVYTSSAGWNLDAGWIPVIALAMPAVVIITGSFVICQIPLHVRMLEYKRERTYAIEALIDKLEPDSASDLTEERVKQLEFLRSAADKVASLPEWPFGWRSLAAAFATSVGAVAPTLIGFFARQVLAHIPR